MSTEELIIAVVRVLGSLPVLLWPFWGGVVAVLVDLSDLFMMNLLRQGGVSSYQSFDKWLDQVYMACFLLVALRWPDPVRQITIGLYGLRMVGFLAFEATGAREVLVAFPNVFEFWFLFVAAFDPRRADVPAAAAAGPGQARAPAAASAGPLGLRFAYTRRNITLALLALLAAKEAQEVIIHWLKLLDSFTAVEAVEAIWGWLTGWL